MQMVVRLEEECVEQQQSGGGERERERDKGGKRGEVRREEHRAGLGANGLRRRGRKKEKRKKKEERERERERERESVCMVCMYVRIRCVSGGCIFPPAMARSR